jgi:hypothetical protein
MKVLGDWKTACISADIKLRMIWYVRSDEKGKGSTQPQ